MRGGQATEEVGGEAGAVARYAEITGWGKALPPTVLTNADLELIVDTSDNWITTRSGDQGAPHLPTWRRPTWRNWPPGARWRPRGSISIRWT